MDEESAIQLEKLKAELGYKKFVVGSILGTALTAVLGYVINQQEVNVKRAEAASQLEQTEQRNLREYFQWTMQGDVYDRLKLSVFFKEILSDEDSRNRWNTYHNELVKQLNRTVELDDTIAKMDRSRETNSLAYKLLVEERTRLQQLLEPITKNLVEASAPSKWSNSLAHKLSIKFLSSNMGEGLTAILSNPEINKLELFNPYLSEAGRRNEMRTVAGELFEYFAGLNLSRQPNGLDKDSAFEELVEILTKGEKKISSTGDIIDSVYLFLDEKTQPDTEPN